MDTDMADTDTDIVVAVGGDLLFIIPRYGVDTMVDHDLMASTEIISMYIIIYT